MRKVPVKKFMTKVTLNDNSLYIYYYRLIADMFLKIRVKRI